MVLITAPIEPHWQERLHALSPDLRVELWSGSSGTIVPAGLWRDVEILYTSFATSLPLPEQAPRLRWVQLYAAGPDPILSHPLFQSPVIFTTASGAHAINMAEYVFTMMLVWFHRFPQVLEWQKKGEWPSPSIRLSLFPGEEVYEKTLGIVGYGSVGRQIARLAHAFGMHVLAMQRGTNHKDRGFTFPNIGDPQGILPERYYTPEQLHSMLSECDVVVIAVPLTRQTRGMFNDAAFQAMKPTAFLVNIARGPICDEEALIRALEEERIAGAALDVFQQEPLPPNHPLWHLPNVFISPHSAGLSPHYNERAAGIFAENLQCYLAGTPLHNVIDKREGY